jgi:uncharacterized protein
MSTEKNVQVVKDFLETIYKALDSSNKQDVLALVADDIEWIIPGKDWPLAGTHRGHAEMVAVVQKASETVEASIEPSDYIAQGDRVFVVGTATGKFKATNKTFKDEWVFDITVRDGKVARIQEYIDTQAVARAAQKDASKLAA